MTDEHHDNLFVEEKRDVQSRMAALRSSERPLLLEAMGGWLGIAESAIPSLAFVIAVTAGAEVKEASIIAVALAAVLGVARLVRRQTIQFALMGIIGVAISAFIATKTGNAKDFFVPSFFINAAYATGVFGTVLFRHPFIGYVVEGLTGGGGDKDESLTAWRQDPVRMRKYTQASIIWGSIFVLRLAVQLPLYFANALVALGTLKIAMGYPLFGLAIWLTWLLVRTPATLDDAPGGLTVDAAAATDVADPTGDQADAAATAEPVRAAQTPPKP